MCVCVSVCVCVRKRPRMFVNLYICMDMYTYSSMYMSEYVHT
jgi:hypothetical protein